MTNMEKLLAFLTGDYTGPLPTPQTRLEKYLAAACGVYEGELPEPITPADAYLQKLAGGLAEKCDDASRLFFKGYLLNRKEYLKPIFGEAKKVNNTFESYTSLKPEEFCFADFFKVEKIEEANSTFRNFSYWTEFPFSNVTIDHPIDLYYTFYGTAITEIENFYVDPEKKGVDYSSSFSNAFYNCKSLKSVRGVTLGHCCSSDGHKGLFGGCIALEEIVDLDIGTGRFEGSTTSFPTGTETAPAALRRLKFVQRTPDELTCTKSFSLAYCSLEREAMVEMFETVFHFTGTVGSGTITITGNPCVTGIRADGTACDVLTEEDKAIVTAKGWTLVE